MHAMRMLGAMPLLALLMPVAGRAADTTAKTTLTIKGMTCGGCVAAVKLQLKKTEGVTAYDVSLDKGEADVTFDPSRTTPEKIAASVSKTGFEASVRKAGEDKARESEGASTGSVSEKEWAGASRRVGQTALFRRIQERVPTSVLCANDHLSAPAERGLTQHLRRSMRPDARSAAK